MATVNFNLSRKEISGGKKELYLRLSVDRNHVLRGRTGILINPKFWNQDKQKLVISRMHTSENEKLVKLQGKISALTNSILEEVMNTQINEINKSWLDKLITDLTGKTVSAALPDESQENSGSRFIEVFEHFISVQCKTIRRVDHFHCDERVLKRFSIYEGISLNLDTFSADNLRDMEKFLMIEHSFFDKDGKCIKHKDVYVKEPNVTVPQKRGINAIHNIMKRIRTFYNWAVKNNYTTNNPFATYKLQACVYGTPFFMTKEERDCLFGFDFSSRPALSIQRDIFVFQSNVGMRAGDLFQLTAANIVDDAVEYVANKTLSETGRTVRVPLSEQAKTIIARYQSNDRIELLPFISMQKYNKAIKEMLKLAGIDRIVTVLNPTTREQEQHPIWEVASSHMARRNFIGNLYNKTQDPNAIGSMTGHVDGSKAFARYRSIGDEVKKNLISQL